MFEHRTHLSHTGWLEKRLYVIVKSSVNVKIKISLSCCLFAARVDPFSLSFNPPPSLSLLQYVIPELIIHLCSYLLRLLRLGFGAFFSSSSSSVEHSFPFDICC